MIQQQQWVRCCCAVHSGAALRTVDTRLFGSRQKFRSHGLCLDIYSHFRKHFSEATDVAQSKINRPTSFPTLSLYRYYSIIPTMAPILSSDILIVVVVLICVSIPKTLSFTANLPYQPSRTTAMWISRMVPLSNEEIFARAAQQKAQTELDSAAAAPPPSLYDDAMLQRMQLVLTLLDQRAVQGPQSLLPIDIEQLDTNLQYILEEMRRNQHLKPQRPSPSSSSPSASAATTAISSTTPSSISTTIAPTPPLNTFQGYSDGDDASDVIDDNSTTNTYIIPNMEQMTPAEYQAELQRTVIEHQKVRRNTGVTGNRASWNYMNTLNPNDTGAMKKEMYE